MTQYLSSERMFMLIFGRQLRRGLCSNGSIEGAKLSKISKSTQNVFIDRPIDILDSFGLVDVKILDFSWGGVGGAYALRFV